MNFYQFKVMIMGEVKIMTVMADTFEAAYEKLDQMQGSESWTIEEIKAEPAEQPRWGKGYL